MDGNKTMKILDKNEKLIKVANKWRNCFSMSKLLNGGDSDYKGKDRELINMPMLTGNKNDVKGPTIVEEKPLGLRKKAVIMQFTMSILANITVLSSGMGLGYPAVTLHSLSDYNSEFTANVNDGMKLNQDQASWFASINAIACPLGGLLCGFILDKFGRKRTLILINIISIVSWGIIASASRTDLQLMYAQLLVGRFIIGIATGLSSSPAAVYSAEIAHPKLRGRLTTFTSLSIALGILMIYTLGYFLPNSWREISLIACIFCVFSLLAVTLIPESPSWLIMKHRLAESETSLKILRGLSTKGTEVNVELKEEMLQLIDQISKRDIMSANDSNWTQLKKPEVYKPLSIMIGFFAFQQFSGIFVIVVYATSFVIEAGVGLDPFLCTVLIGIARVIATLLVGYVLDFLGRKKPSIFSGISMALCMLGLYLCAIFDVTSINWLPVVLIIIYIFTSTLGFLTIPFVMVAEMYPQKIRGLASGLTICAAYTMSFIIIKAYPTMVNVMGNKYVFIFYGLISVAGIFYVWIFLPETKGKTLQEIENMFRSKNTKEQKTCNTVENGGN